MDDSARPVGAQDQILPPVDGYHSAPHIRVIHTWGEPDEDGVSFRKTRIEFDGELFPYMTSGEKPMHDFVHGHPEMGKVVYIPVIAASFEDVIESLPELEGW